MRRNRSKRLRKLEGAAIPLMEIRGAAMKKYPRKRFGQIRTNSNDSRRRLADLRIVPLRRADPAFVALAAG